MPRDRPGQQLECWREHLLNGIDAPHDVAPFMRASAVSVRSLCPFCGSNNEPSSATPCCDQWLEMVATVAADPMDAEWSTDRAARLSGNVKAIAARLNQASQPLVMLLASSFVAMLVSLVMQWRQVDAAPMGPIVRRVVESAPAAAAAPLRVAAAQPVAAPEPEVVPEPPPPPAPPPEQVVSAPEPPPADPEPEAATASVEWSAEFAEKWGHLNRMMSRTAVRALLGEPRWTDGQTTSHLEYWLYKDPTIQGDGWVAFYDGGGPVSSWRDPKTTYGR